MENIRYHEVRASNDKAIFQADDLVDFEFDAFNRKLVKNSVELSGIIKVYKNDASTEANLVVKADAGNLFVDKNSGAHGIIENISVSSVNNGSLEQIGFAYPRFVSMLSVLQNENQDLNDMENVMEWRFPDNDLTSNFLRTQDVQGTANSQFSSDFNIKPRIFLNRCDNNISFSKTGKMRISMNLAQDEKFLVNQLTGAGVNSLVYTVSNLRLRYRTVPEDGSDTPVFCQKMTPLKTTINSSLSSMSLNVPSRTATGCSISFQNVNNEGNSKVDNQKLEKINISSIQFFFNSANSYLNYKLDNTSEIVMRGLKSLSPGNDEAMYQIKSSDLANSNNFIVGSDLDGTIDLSENSFEVQIESDLSVNTNVYLMFHSLISI